MPSLKWTKTSNNTHGYIRATVDFSVGPKPMSVLGYRARTLNNKRFVRKNTLFLFNLVCNDNRRDFRLLIGDPNNPGKAIVNPVIWLQNPVVTEVIILIFFSCLHQRLLI